MCCGVDVLLSWGYLSWQQNPEFFFCTVEVINCSTEVCANIPMLSIATLGQSASRLQVPLFVLTCYHIHYAIARFPLCDSYLWPLIFFFSFSFHKTVVSDEEWKEAKAVRKMHFGAIF